MLLKHQVALCQSNLIDNLQTTQHPENLVHLLPTEVNSMITVSSSIAESLMTSLFAILLITIQFNNLVPRVLSLVSKEENREPWERGSQVNLQKTSPYIKIRFKS